LNKEGSHKSVSRFQIIPFDADAASRETWTAFHAFRRAIAAELDPDDPVVSDAEREYEIRRANPLWDSKRWLAIDGPDVVGSVGAGFRRLGTPNAEEHAPFLSGWGSVLATARRRGAGTLLLRQIHALMHAMDKSVLTLSAETDAGHAFLTHVGAAAKNSTVDCRVRFNDLDWRRLRAWESVAGDLGLVWECYAGRVPRDVLLPLLPTFSALASDVPQGSLEMPPIRVEIEAFDEWYECLDRTEGTHHLVLLREQDGTVVGFSEARWDNRTPKAAYQLLTAIARTWRGRGLARAVKAAMLRQVRAFHPGAEEMRTSNDEVNAAILSINMRLGFNVQRRHVDYQITRAELDVKLTTRVGPRQDD
jgi:RimJ/RimL family protein N-acetyltransferase